MSRIVECRGCAWHLIDGRWLYQINTKADDVACCPACLRAEEERDRLLYEANRRKAAARIRDGFGPAPEGVDPFRGFREP